MNHQRTMPNPLSPPGLLRNPLLVSLMRKISTARQTVDGNLGFLLTTGSARGSQSVAGIGRREKLPCKPRIVGKRGAHLPGIHTGWMPAQVGQLIDLGVGEFALPVLGFLCASRSRATAAASPVGTGLAAVTSSDLNTPEKFAQFE